MERKCENCKYYREGFYNIDCLNEDISQEEYERCLGQGEDNCEAFEMMEQSEES